MLILSILMIPPLLNQIALSNDPNINLNPSSIDFDHSCANLFSAPYPYYYHSPCHFLLFIASGSHSSQIELGGNCSMDGAFEPYFSSITGCSMECY